MMRELYDFSHATTLSNRRLRRPNERSCKEMEEEEEEGEKLESCHRRKREWDVEEGNTSSFSYFFPSSTNGQVNFLHWKFSGGGGGGSGSR